MSLSDRMQAALRDARISKAEIARRLEVSPQAVNGWFKTGTILKGNLARFAKETGVSLEWLVGGEEDLVGENLPLTLMGGRILEFMTANNLTDRDEFAHALGITRERFNAWLYRDIKDVEVRPLLRCADALTTNAEYLIGDSDDPRPVAALDWREHQLLTTFRDLPKEKQDLLLQTASAWHVQGDATPTTNAPFRIAVPAGEERSK